MARYVDYTDSEDMQDDTYKIITQLIIDCVVSVRAYDVETLYTNLHGLYLLIWKRLPAEDQERIQRKLEEVNNNLHGLQGAGGLKRSTMFDTCCALLKEITGCLDEQGILFRMRADTNTLVARRSS